MHPEHSHANAYPYGYPYPDQSAAGPHAARGPTAPAAGAYGQGAGYPYPGTAGPYGPAHGLAAPTYPVQGGYGYPSHDSGFLGLTNERFLKGLLVGAAAAYLLTNDSVQRNAIKAVVKVWSVLQGGVEEMKERFHDAEAELRASEGSAAP